MLRDFVQLLLHHHVDGDPSRFDELWSLVPDLLNEIRGSIEKQNSWVYLRPGTFDGWYLIKTSSGYEVYYQERSINCWGTRRFTDERLALKALLQSSGALECRR